jgi:hypothetical protein
MASKRASYCRFSRKRIICPYEPEERTVTFCIACRTSKLASQQDLMIKQNKAIITLLNHIRDLLQEERTR